MPAPGRGLGERASGDRDDEEGRRVRCHEPGTWGGDGSGLCDTG
jgi:hypothetical protein